MSVHNLRDRALIYSPLRYTEQPQTWNSPETLRRKRGGKKGSITKRIKQIDEIIVKRGSRSKLMVLLEQLNVTLNDAIILHDALMEKIDKNEADYSDDYIEELSIEVDTCTSNVMEYLEERAGTHRRMALATTVPSPATQALLMLAPGGGARSRGYLVQELEMYFQELFPPTERCPLPL